MKKDYKPLVLWLVTPVLFIVAIPMLMFSMPDEILEKLPLAIFMIYIYLFMLYIHKHDKLYYINGFDFNKVEKISKDMRASITRKHFEKIKKYTIIFFVYFIIGVFFKFNIFLDMLMFLYCVLAFAFSTLNIKE